MCSFDLQTISVLYISKGYIRVEAEFACCRRRGGGDDDWRVPVEGALTGRTEIEKTAVTCCSPITVRKVERNVRYWWLARKRRQKTYAVLESG